MTASDTARRRAAERDCGLAAPPGLTPECTRVLLAVLLVHSETGAANVRAVAERLGSACSTTFHHLTTLRRHGLVTWEVGRSGTLRPLVALHATRGGIRG